MGSNRRRNLNEQEFPFLTSRKFLTFKSLPLENRKGSLSSLRGSVVNVHFLVRFQRFFNPKQTAFSRFNMKQKSFQDNLFFFVLFQKIFSVFASVCIIFLYIYK